MRVSLLLLLLCLRGLTAAKKPKTTTAKPEPLTQLTEKNLYVIWKYVTENYNPDPQQSLVYAVAIAIPKTDCNNDLNEEKLRSILNEDKPDDVKESLNTENAQNPKMYTGAKLIAARPLKYEKQGFTEHAEMRLLLTHLHNLYNNNVGSCLFFFVSKSPCLGKCLNRNNNHNILTEVKRIPKYFQVCAFVFEKLFDDLKTTKFSWRSFFQELVKEVPLYRCNSSGCHSCFTNFNRKVDDSSQCFRE